ncbi:MAG TPA: peptidoglycan-binding protein [Candidatus Enterenecus stercoripullorum]|nr:peptidoglycan-binding protein [Candidatus Enterenecus stercoripullorum]
MPFNVTPYIPQYITVHLAPADQAAENVTVSFSDYIKNVASSEIYPTWPEEALRANILAQISFALNRIYTEYYRSRGYDFDITSSPVNDQKFIKGRSTFENVDRLVDELFTSYIRRQGYVEPLSARFCNGTTVTCDGLSQWGSEALARQGYNAMEILRYYYGDDIELVTSAPVQQLTNSYPGYPLRNGSSGEYVVVLQTMLNRVARNYPAIPRINPVDGIFGPQTERAVREFQRIFNLSVDGVVGQATWYKLVSLYVGVTRLSELTSEGQTFTQVQAPASGVTLQEGSTGPAVSALQFFITVLGQVLYNFPTLNIDGIFGPNTRQAVMDAQRYLGLEPTGVVDDQTWMALYDAYTSVARTLLASQNLPLTPEEIEEQVLSGQFPGYNLTYAL